MSPLLAIAARLLAFILMSREAGNDQRGQDAKDYQGGHYLHEARRQLSRTALAVVCVEPSPSVCFRTHLIVFDHVKHRQIDCKQDRGDRAGQPDRQRWLDRGQRRCLSFARFRAGK